MARSKVTARVTSAPAAAMRSGDQRKRLASASSTASMISAPAIILVRAERPMSHSMRQMSWQDCVYWAQNATGECVGIGLRAGLFGGGAASPLGRRGSEVQGNAPSALPFFYRLVQLDVACQKRAERRL